MILACSPFSKILEGAGLVRRAHAPIFEETADARQRFVRTGDHGAGVGLRKGDNGAGGFAHAAFDNRVGSQDPGPIKKSQGTASAADLHPLLFAIAPNGGHWFVRAPVLCRSLCFARDFG
jgi:hypothetical protein